MLTWADRLRDPVVVGAAAAALLLVDVAAAVHLRAEQERCGSGRALPTSRLAVTLELATAVPPAGNDLRAEATVTNPTRHALLLLGADGVLLSPGTHRVLSWTRPHRFDTVELAPGSATRVPVVVHLERCDRGSPRLTPGFYELAFALVEGDRTGSHRTVSPPRAVVLPP